MAKYSDEDKAEALAKLDALDGNLTATANETGIPRSTLARWRKGEGISPAVPELRQIKKAALADRYESISHLYLDRVQQKEVVAATGGRDAMIIAATATDKMRLLRGLPTEIIQLLPPLVQAIEAKGMSAADVFEKMLQRLNADA